MLDAELAKFLSELEREGHLNRSLLVLLADHGARYSNYRDSLQGKLEERLPLLTVAAPLWFREQRPSRSLWLNLLQNAEQALATPFDLHQTLLHLLELAHKTTTLPPPQDSSNYSPVNNYSLLSNYSRGYYMDRFISFREVGKYGQATSLFLPINRDRTCSTVGIPMHFCPCLHWIPLDLDRLATGFTSLIRDAATFIVDQINLQTEPHRSKCAPLSVNKTRHRSLERRERS